MRRMVVCFANVQEGRDAALLRDMAKAASSWPGASLLRMFSDRTFHRSGLCIAGDPSAVVNAVVDLVTVASRRIDLESSDRVQDKNIHHHIGAVDLLPFHPLGTGGPTEAQADRPTHVGVPFDYGPATPSKRSGITVCGATPYVLNYNMILDTDDLVCAKEIAAAVRGASKGGAPGVESMAYLKAYMGRGMVAEVACNLREPSSELGCPKEVLSRVQSLAAAKGTRVWHEYCTNPTPAELDAWVLSGSTAHSDHIDWKTPPGEPPFD